MPKLKPKSRRCIASIDYDFFIYNPSFIPGKMVEVTYQGEKKEAPAISIYDWGHSERHSPALGDLLWQVRRDGFKRFGLDIVKEYNIRPEVGCTPLAEFAAKLLKKLPPRTFEMKVSDSHVEGYTFAQSACMSGLFPRPTTLFLFDAHHDLGYGPSADSDTCDCGSWAFAALKCGYVDNVIVVYPDWRGTAEYEPKRMPWTKYHRRQIKVMTWSDWLAKDWSAYDLTDMHACRSSAWTPPWLDSQFNEFVKMFPSSGVKCYDDNNFGGYHAQRCRQWDSNAPSPFAEAEAAMDAAGA